MSSEPTRRVRTCPHCDASVRGNSNVCWLCGAAMETPAVIEPTDQAPAVIEPAEQASSEQRVVQQFSLSSLLLIITLLAVVLGVTRLVPGLGIALAIVTTPALIRTCIIVTLKKTHGNRMPTADKMTLFLTSLGAVLIIAVAGGVAFYVTCWGGFFGGMVVTEPWSTGYDSLGWGLLTGVVLGGIVGLYVIYLLTRLMWFPRKSKPAKPAKGPADERGQAE